MSSGLAERSHLETYLLWKIATIQTILNLPLVQMFLGKTFKTVLIKLKQKVKCTLVQALRLCTGRTTHKGSRGIALTFHDHGTRRG